MTPSSFLAPWPRLRRCCRAALLALAALLAVPVAAAAADEARLGEMLLAIEHDGRADPLSAARRLEAARAQLPADGELPLQALMLLGLMRASAHDNEGAERALEQLEAWAREHNSTQALAAAGLVRARGRHLRQLHQGRSPAQ